MVIGFENINGGYGRKQVLFNINATIGTGEIVSIVGANGCGKTTLLETASGLITPFGGKVTVNGEDVHKMNPGKRAQTISVLSQQKNVGVLTVRALTYHGRFPYLGYPRKYTEEDSKIVNEAMKKAGVIDVADESVSELSGGQQQKAYIAMMIAQNTEIVFMDEPVTFLDINYQLELMNLIKKMKSDGKTIVMVIHDLNLAMSYSDRIMALKQGRLLYMGTPKEIYEENVFSDLFNIETHYSKSDNQYFFKRKFC